MVVKVYVYINAISYFCVFYTKGFSLKWQYSKQQLRCLPETSLPLLSDELLKQTGGQGSELRFNEQHLDLRTTRGTDQALVSGASHLSPLQGKCRSLKINLFHTQCPAVAARNCHTWHTASGWDLTSVSTPTAGYSQDGDTTPVIFRYLFQLCHKRC